MARQREERLKPPTFFGARVRIDRQALRTMNVGERFIEIELELSGTYDRGFLHPLDILPVAYKVESPEDLGPPPDPATSRDYAAEAFAYAAKADPTPIGQNVGLYIDQQGRVTIGQPTFSN